MKAAESVYKDMRLAESKIMELRAAQVPAELFHYTLSQMRTIRVLYILTRDNPGGVQLKVLAEKLRVTPAAASEMVDTLVRKNALTRRIDPADRRAVLLQLGDELRERFEESENSLARLVAKFLRTLPADEVETARVLAEKFAAFVSESELSAEV